MADITKCEGFNCPIKELCYRYTSEDDPCQSYFVMKKDDSLYKDGSCDYFYEDRYQ